MFEGGQRRRLQGSRGEKAVLWTWVVAKVVMRSSWILRGIWKQRLKIHVLSERESKCPLWVAN